MSVTSPHPAPATLDLDAELARHRGPLIGYCYRMLGSAFEAEDAVQETMLRAWRSFEQYEGRAPFKSWLYRIATNVCFDLLAGRQRRAMPMDLAAPSQGDRPMGTPPADIAWLQPIPDLLLTDDPAERTAGRESVRLAFVAALQRLQPRQRAVLILRDVLAWHATEVAELLDMTPTSVHSMLRRAREAVAGHDGQPGAATEIDTALLARYVEAFERYDIEALVALLRDDAVFSMPPNAMWLQGPAEIGRWYRRSDTRCRELRVVPTSPANGSGAFGLYLPSPGGFDEAFAVQLVETRAGAITGLHTFIEPRLFALFGLPFVLG